MSNENLMHFYSTLSTRKQEVLYWAAQGLSNPQVGAKLYISSQAVADHLTIIYANFGFFLDADEPINRYHILRYFGNFFGNNPHLAPTVGV